MLSKWTEIESESAKERALSVCRGCYQRNLVRGLEALSGSTLRGKAKGYGARYQASARNLLARMRQAGLLVTERRAAHGRRVLVIAERR